MLATRFCRTEQLKLLSKIARIAVTRTTDHEASGCRSATGTKTTKGPDHLYTASCCCCCRLSTATREITDQESESQKKKTPCVRKSISLSLSLSPMFHSYSASSAIHLVEGGKIDCLQLVAVVDFQVGSSCHLHCTQQMWCETRSQEPRGAWDSHVS